MVYPQQNNNFVLHQPYYAQAQPHYDYPMPNYIPQVEQPPVGAPVDSSVEIREIRVVTNQYGRLPAAVLCSGCKRRVTTTVYHEIKADTGIIMCILCCLFWPAMFIPLCVDSCKTTSHYCQNCRKLLAVIRPDCCSSF